jgi:hypothetical protein
MESVVRTKRSITALVAVSVVAMARSIWQLRWLLLDLISRLYYIFVCSMNYLSNFNPAINCGGCKPPFQPQLVGLRKKRFRQSLSSVVVEIIYYSQH